MSTHKMVEVYRAKDISQAHILRSTLENAGIPALVEGDSLLSAIGEIPGGWSSAPRILVEEDHVPTARLLLEQWECSQ